MIDQTDALPLSFKNVRVQLFKNVGVNLSAT